MGKLTLIIHNTGKKGRVVGLVAEHAAVSKINRLKETMTKKAQITIDPGMKMALSTTITGVIKWSVLDLTRQTVLKSGRAFVGAFFVNPTVNIELVDDAAIPAPGPGPLPAPPAVPAGFSQN